MKTTLPEKSKEHRETIDKIRDIIIEEENIFMFHGHNGFGKTQVLKIMDMVCSGNIKEEVLKGLNLNLFEKHPQSIPKKYDKKLKRV